jgi:uncharacterized protein YbbC (DUF1343 family)
VGRGTDRPFEWVGAPWIDGPQLAAELRKEPLEGVRFVPLRVTPTGSVHKGAECGGVQIIVSDWAVFEPVRTGVAFASCLRRVYPKDWQVDRYDRLLGHKATFEGVKAGKGWAALEKEWKAESAKFVERRKPFLLYPGE